MRHGRVSARFRCWASAVDTAPKPGPAYNRIDATDSTMGDAMSHVTHRLTVLAAGLLVSGVLVTACTAGSPGRGVASVGPSTPTGTSSSSGSARAGVLAYSRCMRAHGIRDYPDPDSNGELQINAHEGSDLNPDNPRFKAADNACKSLLPPQGSNPSKTQQLRTAILEYAKCMRSHGISDFPDPKADGSLAINAKPGSDLDPDNPLYQAAERACASLWPSSNPGS